MEGEIQPPAYLSNPVIHRTLHYLMGVIDELYDATEDKPAGRNHDVVRLKNTLVTVFQRIFKEGELEELDTILRLHFSHYYPEEAPLLDYPLTTCN